MVENLKGEIWKPVKGYEGLYEASDMGRVKSLNYGRMGEERLMKPTLKEGGYLVVNLWRNNKCRLVRVHRLVYEAFNGYIPPFTNYGHGDERMEINHIDEDKTNNKLSNLELVSHKENNAHETRKERQKKAVSKRVYQYTLDKKLIRIWDCVIDCARSGFFNIGTCCNNKYGTNKNIYKGYIWSYTPLEK